MSGEVAIRKKWDRFRYAVFLEITLMAMFIPVLVFIFEREVGDMTLLGLGLSTIAILYTLLYNYVFDRIDVSLGNIPTERSYRGRVIHAVTFEVTMLLFTLPFIVWWMRVDLWTAIALDVGFTVYIVVWTFFYTLGYDKLFPVSQLQEAQAAVIEAQEAQL